MLTWTPWLTGTTSTEAQFTGSPGHSYYFQVRATDQVNNTGAWQQAGPVAIRSVTKYYTFGSSRVAMRQGDEVYYLHGDHLGSTSLTTDGSGAVVAQSRYLPYGQERWSDGAAPTDFGFTGQRNEAGFGLMDYNARYYSPGLGRFVSPDTIVPHPSEPQAFNRYAYVYNNPLKYTDPSGHTVPTGQFCILCNKQIADTQGWSDLAVGLAKFGCLLAGCHVDTEANVIMGPTTEEFASTFGLDFVSPMTVVGKPLARGLGTVGRLGDLTNFEKTVAKTIKESGDEILGYGDDAVRQVLGISDSTKAADFLSVTEGGRFNITEVKGSIGSAGADVDSALRQISNTVDALYSNINGAKIGRLEIAIPQGGILGGVYDVSGDQLIRVTEQGTEVVRIAGQVIHVKQIP